MRRKAAAVRRRRALALLTTLALTTACAPSGRQATEAAAPRPTLAAPRSLDLPSGLELPVERADASLVVPLFERECAVCHGLEGRGDGPRAPVLRPPPADLTNPARMGAIAPTWLHRSIVEGKGGMPSWAFQLEPRETWDLAFLAWSRALGPKAGDEARFAAHCAACHGGSDAAAAATRLDHASRAAASFDEALSALAEGPHAGLRAVSEAEREAALRWSYTYLYRPAPAATAGPP